METFPDFSRNPVSGLPANMALAAMLAAAWFVVDQKATLLMALVVLPMNADALLWKRFGCQRWLPDVAWVLAAAGALGFYLLIRPMAGEP